MTNLIKRCMPLILGMMSVVAGITACAKKTSSQSSVMHPMYEAHCKEPLPVFTLSEHSNPSKEQEATLCSCIWKNLGSWERRASSKIAEGKEAEISWLDKTAFPSRIGKEIRECGGMDL